MQLDLLFTPYVTEQKGIEIGEILKSLCKLFSIYNIFMVIVIPTYFDTPSTVVSANRYELFSFVLWMTHRKYRVT